MSKRKVKQKVKQKVDVEGILETLSSIRQKIPILSKTPAKPKVEDTAADMGAFVAGTPEEMEAFEMETLADALESFADELSESIEMAQQRAMEQAMEVYYAAEELAKDPEHAHLIPYVEEMRKIYRRDFGKDIPKRK
ncbi:MAG TPA: hypothetical protein VF713_25420 [Thermoanaerobaculia bacterium]